MKFFIIGLHSSGKHELAHSLEEMGLKYGKLFSNYDTTTKHVYANDEYEQYNIIDINEVFENNAYVFIQERNDEFIYSSIKCFEGLSKYSYDNNDVFVLSPDQFMSISAPALPSDAVYVWLDNTKHNRINRHKMEKRDYNFNSREVIERRDMKEFVKVLYNASNNILYFTNEDINRVASIIYSIHKHPDLLSTFVKNYN